MGDLFEEFVRGFLQHAFTGPGGIPKRSFRWANDDPSGLLPSLQTDLFIEQPGRITVGECKCYKSPLSQGRSGT